MIIFRISLYLICIASIGWSALIFGGPFIIKKVILGYTNGAVIPSDITVSPTLAIKFGRLDFAVKSEALEMPIKGFSRATEISWSLLGNKPFFELNFGPSVLKNHASIDKIKVATPPFGDMTLENSLLISEVENLNLNSFGTVEEVNIQVTMNFLSSAMTNIHLKANSTTAQLSGLTVGLESISGTISNFNFSNAFEEQVFFGEFWVDDIIVSEPDLSSLAADVEFSVTEGITNFKTDFTDVRLSKFGGLVQRVEVAGNFAEGNILQDFNIELLNGAFASKLPEFSAISTKIKEIGGKNYEAFIEGSLKEYEITNSENFLGLLPPSDFEIVFQINEADPMTIMETNIIFKNAGSANISGSAGLVLKSGMSTVLECAFSNCDLPSFDFTYQLSMSDDWIRGSAKCPMVSCDLADINFRVRTSNTANLFTNLSQMGILSPLSSLYLYGMMASGEKIKDGHDLKF